MSIFSILGTIQHLNTKAFSKPHESFDTFDICKNSLPGKSIRANTYGKSAPVLGNVCPP